MDANFWCLVGLYVLAAGVAVTFGIREALNGTPRPLTFLAVFTAVNLLFIGAAP